MKSYFVLFALLLALSVEVLGAGVAVKSVAVKGIVKCGNNAAENVKVVLYRVDSKGEFGRLVNYW